MNSAEHDGHSNSSGLKKCQVIAVLALQNPSNQGSFTRRPPDGKKPGSTASKGTSGENTNSLAPVGVPTGRLTPPPCHRALCGERLSIANPGHHRNQKLLL